MKGSNITGVGHLEETITARASRDVPLALEVCFKGQTCETERLNAAFSRSAYHEQLDLLEQVVNLLCWSSLWPRERTTDLKYRELAARVFGREYHLESLSREPFRAVQDGDTIYLVTGEIKRQGESLDFGAMNLVARLYSTDRTTLAECMKILGALVAA